MMAPVHQFTQRPQLTLPPAEAAWLREVYEDATVILEYGSGGSTVMAAEMKGKTVFSVESDQAWMNGLQAWLDDHDLAQNIHLHHGNVGPTKEWGMPINTNKWRAFPSYALSVWDRPDFQHPDVVLVDGRFRRGCALATLLRCQRPVTIYFDDYINRKHYHQIETFMTRGEVRGRMARFDVEPTAVDATRLIEIFETLTAAR